ncbi:MAG: MBOAT family protein [Clostridiales bacterium]|nr:MBOAT family protein [Clostridiales bacterium]
MIQDEKTFSRKYIKWVVALAVLAPVLIIAPSWLLQDRDFGQWEWLVSGSQMGVFSAPFLLFLAVVGAFYFYLGHRQSSKQWIVLLVASYFFYATAGILMLLPIIITTVVTWAGARLIEQTADHYKSQLVGKEFTEKKQIREKSVLRRRILLAIVIVVNLGILVSFKYTNFVIENVTAVTGQTVEAIDFLVPLGLSFYTFQPTGYLIDVYRGKYRADQNPVRFALFVSYFPQIIQGPIGRYDKLAGQLFQIHRFDYERVKFGAQRMLWGFFKKLVIADRVSILVNTVFADFGATGTASYEGFTVFLAVLLYGVEIYTDFSGGMDIVIGVSQIFGIEMTENFRRPFMARSVAEFWQRWHITLGSWMRDYLFYPLALSKPFNNLSKKLRKTGDAYVAKILPTCIASFIVFFLIGVWHGANWKYIIYGIYQAIFVSTATLLEPFYAKCRAFFHINVERSGWKMFQTLRTVFLITIGRYLSRANTASQAFAMLKATFSRFNPWVFFDGSLFNLGLDEKNFRLMILCILFLFIVDFIQEKGNTKNYIRQQIAGKNIVVRWAIYLVGLFAVIIFGVYGSGYDTASFIYAGF